MMRWITYMLLMFPYVLLLMLMTTPNGSQARFVLDQDMQMEAEDTQGANEDTQGAGGKGPDCGTGQMDGTYCEAGRCPCTPANTVCNPTTNVCECDVDFTNVDGTCTRDCGTGQMDGTYCEAGRCSCTPANTVCNPTTNVCECDVDYTNEGGTCTHDLCLPTARYFFDDTKRTWSEAQTYCQQNGGDLAEFKTVNEANMFESSFLRCAATKTLSWIGLRSGDAYLTYKWLNGDAMDAAISGALSWSDTREKSSQTVPDDKECMAVQTLVAMYVYDQPCETERYGVACQRNP